MCEERLHTYAYAIYDCPFNIFFLHSDSWKVTEGPRNGSAGTVGRNSEKLKYHIILCLAITSDTLIRQLRTAKVCPEEDAIKDAIWT